MPKKYTKEQIIEVLVNQRQVVENGCHEFTGFKGPQGYGQAKYLGKSWRVPKLWWVLHKGEVPSNLHILHNCDNPACFNLEHLRLGTHAENMRDKVLRPRPYQITPGPIVARTWHKLTEETAKQAVMRMKQGDRQSIVADELCVSRQTINDLACGKTWKYLTTKDDLEVMKKLALQNKSVAQIGNAHTKGMSYNKGTSHGRSIFTEEQVKEIKKELVKNNCWQTVVMLSDKYNCSRTAISHIRKGSRWKHIEV